MKFVQEASPQLLFNYALLLSLLLHLLFIFSTFDRAEREIPKQDLVTIHILHSIQEVQATPQAVPQTPTEAVKGAKTQGTAPSVGAKNTSKLNYKDLLRSQRGEGAFEVESASENSAYTGAQKGALLTKASELTVNFDLPLSLRRELKEAKTQALLKRENNSIEIVSLTGTPELRSALFEVLQEKASYKKLEDIFTYFDSKEFILKVHYRTKHIDVEKFEYETKYKVSNKELLLEMTRYLSSVGGFNRFTVEKDQKTGRTTANLNFLLDDKDAKLARERDRLKLQDLRSRPAYERPITHFTLHP